MSAPPHPPSSSVATLPRDHIGALLIAVLLMAFGWLGIAEIVRGSVPTLRTVFQFLLLLFFAVSGTAMPFVFYLNVRFVPLARALPPSLVIVRQSAWVAFFVVGCAGMQLLYVGAERALNLWSALLLALGLLLLEWRIRLREQNG